MTKFQELENVTIKLLCIIVRQKLLIMHSVSYQAGFQMLAMNTGLPAYLFRSISPVAILIPLSNRIRYRRTNQHEQCILMFT